MTDPETSSQPADLSDPASSASAPSPSLDRAAIDADLAAILAWTRTSARWALLDQLVRLLTGRSLTQRSSAISWAVMNLPDDELETLLSGILERTAGYLGLAPAAGPPDAAERAAALHLVELAGLRRLAQ